IEETEEIDVKELKPKFGDIRPRIREIRHIGKKIKSKIEEILPAVWEIRPKVRNTPANVKVKEIKPQIREKPADIEEIKPQIREIPPKVEETKPQTRDNLSKIEYGYFGIKDVRTDVEKSGNTKRNLYSDSLKPGEGEVYEAPKLEKIKPHKIKIKSGADTKPETHKDKINTRHYENISTMREPEGERIETPDYSLKLPEISSRFAHKHFSIGNSLAGLKMYDDAIDEYREAITINPDYTEARYNMGILLYQLRRYSEAEKEFKKVINFNSEFISAYYNLAELYFVTKAYEKSLDVSKNALKISSTPYDKIISKFLILINSISLRRDYELSEFLKFLKKNKRYKLTYCFNDIKESIKGSPYRDRILALIDNIEELKY
ncbi:MAG: hypothetical protein CVT90_02450, partial [Candidatus Altiarchaeales archaeon HGW-Altiarchaeales-3]